MIPRTVLLLCAGFATIPTLAPVAAQAEPGGCLKYGAVGAVGGHMANHGVLGAAGGCVAGMYVRHKYRKEAAQKAALWDQEHPGGKGSIADKAAEYDNEHKTQPGSMPPTGTTTGTPATAPGTGNTPM